MLSIRKPFLLYNTPPSSLKSLLCLSNPLHNKAGKLSRTPAQLRFVCSLNLVVAGVPFTAANILWTALLHALPIPVLLSITIRSNLVGTELFSSMASGAIKVSRFCRMAFWIVSTFIDNASAISGRVSPWLYFICIWVIIASVSFKFSGFYFTYKIC